MNRRVDKASNQSLQRVATHRPPEAQKAAEHGNRNTSQGHTSQKGGHNQNLASAKPIRRPAPDICAKHVNPGVEG